ncbi:NmrA family transcriptional regulator [Fibrisoma montanum]|uniref:NmrA family transcriptional regulator n=1 Tax=Fibrisoma montanum TaxID=2305895 RepID=A0A418MC86_9BACT|nr:NmrA family NAD(P)-binding protein [Fibrisoma montanum]RIV23993.1 NmrA family transcriptional regulator [Fibrisoma montanum]
MIQTNEPILITSATGKTGYETTLQLLKDGYRVRIFVRSRNTRALELEKLGAELAIGEFGQYESLTKALKGVKRVYYCHPIMPGMPQHVKLFIRAAEEAQLDAIVFMGQWLAEFDDQESMLTNDIKTAYQLLEASGLPVVYFNPGYFAENVAPLIEFIVQLGIMPSPFGVGKCPWISSQDLGAVAAALLKNPAPYVGQKIHPTGPESVSAEQMAAVFTKVSGRKVRLLNIPDQLFLKAGFMTGKEFGYDAFSIVQGNFYNQQFRLNRFDVGGPTDVVNELTGREPESFETIAHRLIQQSPYGKRTFTTWLSAVRKFMSMPFTPLPHKRQLAALNQS